VIHRPEEFGLLIAAALDKLHPLRLLSGVWCVYREREQDYEQDDGSIPP
jgi:hypothetical protein